MSSGKAPVLNTGYKLPGIGYGTWQAKEGEAEAGIFEALRIGYRHLDLAKVYRNQVEIGKAIKRSLAEIPGLKREDIFITSKLWNNKHDPKDVEPALDETLAELGLDYLDLYLIHWPVAFTPSDNLFPKKNDNEMGLSPTITITDTWKAMIALPKSKVRSVGVSNFNIDHIEAIIEETGVVPAVNQIERHPLLPNLPLIEYCAKKHIVITAYSAFGNNDVGAPLLVNSPEIKAIAEKLSQKQGKTVTAAQVILAWSQIGGHTVIPKSIKPERIQENFNEVELDEEAIAAVNKIGENPRRYNLPINYSPKWDINLFNLPDEQAAGTKVLLK